MVTTAAELDLPDRTLVRVFRHFFRMPLLLLAALECVALLVVPIAARTILEMPVRSEPWAPAFTYAALNLLALLSMGLYSRRQRSRLLGILLRVAAAIAIGGVGVVILSYMFPALAIERPVFLATVPIACLLLFGIRYAFESTVDEEIFKRRVLVYGAGKRALSVTQLRRRNDTRGFCVLGYVPSEGDRTLVPADRLAAPPGTLLQYCRRHDVDEIVVAMDDRRRAFPVHELLECRLAGEPLGFPGPYAELVSGVPNVFRVLGSPISPGKSSRSQFLQTLVRPTLVVFDPPSFDLLDGVVQRLEPMNV